MNIRSLYRKLYLVLILSACLTISLLYVLLSGKTTNQKESTNDTVVTVQPTISPTYTPTASPTQTPEIITYDTTSNDSFIRIVNKSHTIEADYIPSDLVSPNVSQYENQKLRSEAATALENMFQAAKNNNISLYLVSAYRSYSFQEDLQVYYQDKLGATEAERVDCIPGASEHQIGLAVDLCTTDHLYELNTNFDSTEAYQWLIQNCSDYGYILRYPNGKEDITGIKYSPWNFRYVGVDYAKAIMDSNLTMEEYFSSN